GAADQARDAAAEEARQHPALRGRIEGTHRGDAPRGRTEGTHRGDASVDEIRIERGDPTDDEIAALIAVLLNGRSGGPAPAPTAPRGTASARPARGRTGRPGPGAWRASGLPG